MSPCRALVSLVACVLFAIVVVPVSVVVGVFGIVRMICVWGGRCDSMASIETPTTTKTTNTAIKTAATKHENSMN